MPHAEVGAGEGHHEPVAPDVVLIGGEPVEAAVEGQAPGIPQAPADDLEICAVGVAAEDAAAGVTVGREAIALPPGSRPIGRRERDGPAIVHRAAPAATLESSRNARGALPNTGVSPLDI